MPRMHTKVYLSSFHAKKSTLMYSICHPFMPRKADYCISVIVCHPFMPRKADYCMSVIVCHPFMPRKAHQSLSVILSCQEKHTNICLSSFHAKKSTLMYVCCHLTRPNAKMSSQCQSAIKELRPDDFYGNVGSMKPSK
jgi:hypothetical protein